VKHPIAGENATHLNRGRERLTSDLRVRSPPDICFSRRRLSLYAAAQLSAEPTIACLRTWSVSRRPPGTVANGSRREVTGDDTKLTRYPLEQCLRTARSRWTETSLKSAESAFQHDSCPRGPRRSPAPRGERFVYALANRLRYSPHLESDDRPYSCPQARLARAVEFRIYFLPRQVQPQLVHWPCTRSRLTRESNQTASATVAEFSIFSISY
jgi:hypothetical protein